MLMVFQTNKIFIKEQLIVGLNFSENELIHVCFTSELKNFVAYCVFWQNLALYSVA